MRHPDVGHGQGSAPTMPSGSETILVVEDYPATQRAMKRALEVAGYTTLLASDGEEGLETARAHRSEIHLVISDLVMPKRGGFWLLDALKEEGIEAKVLVVTGYADVIEYVEYSHMPFVRKPWTIPELLTKVRETLDATREARER